MNQLELKQILIAYINNYSLSLALSTLADIADEASQNSPNFGWGQDARLIRTIVPKVEN